MESLLPSLDSFKHSTERGLCLSLASEQLGNPARMKVGATAAWARRQPPERHRVPTIAAPKLDGPTQGRCPPEPYLERYSSRLQFLARKLDRSLNPGAATNQASRFPARATVQQIEDATQRAAAGRDEKRFRAAEKPVLARKLDRSLNPATVKITGVGSPREASPSGGLVGYFHVMTAPGARAPAACRRIDH